MAPTSSGQQNGSGHPRRNIGFDDFDPRLRGNGAVAHRIGAQVVTSAAQGHSGRRLVIVAVLSVLLLWGGLYIAFQRWRASYRERAAYGASHVAASVGPLKDIVPPDVDPGVWRAAVEQTRAMLTTVAASNLLDRGDIDNLCFELDQFVSKARAHPETAKNELAAIWNQMADRAEFLFQDSRSPTRDRHVRPRILPPRPVKASVKPSSASA
jgi:hypothetical protein